MNGTVTSTVDSLLQRCCTEVDFESKLLLATCLGEVGAIGANRLGEMRMDPHRAETTGDDSSLWRLKQAPWQSSAVRYELKVVTTHLVVALKAAPSSGDQHKIAFAIQQLLELLDEHAKMSNRSDSSSLNVGQALDRPARGQMSDWLREQLSDAGVVEIIEPYWSSNFIEVSAWTFLLSSCRFLCCSKESFNCVSDRTVWAEGATFLSELELVLFMAILLVQINVEALKR